jgi:hypothetical protein
VLTEVRSMDEERRSLLAGGAAYPEGPHAQVASFPSSLFDGRVIVELTAIGEPAAAH